MKIPDYPGPGLRTPAESDGTKNNTYKGLVIENRLGTTGSEALEIPAYNAPAETSVEPTGKGLFFSAVLKRQAYDDLREIKSSLLIDLMDDVLPRKIRQRWIQMLTDVDFVSTDSGSRIERLCRECTAGRANIDRLLRHEKVTLDRRRRADTELVMLYNGFNNLANQWWLYKSMPE